MVAQRFPRLLHLLRIVLVVNAGGILSLNGGEGLEADGQKDEQADCRLHECDFGAPSITDTT